MKRIQTTRRGFVSAMSCALGLGALGGLAGCGGAHAPATTEGDSSQASSTRKFTDSCGREVELPDEITKIVPSGPTTQQILLTIKPSLVCGLATKLADAQIKVLGDSVAALPVFGQIYGGKGDFNKESVASAEPQLIIDVGESKDTIVQDMDDLQEQLGVPCVHIESSLDSYDKIYEQLGELLGQEARCSDLAGYCRDVYDEVTGAVSTIPEEDRPRVAYLLGDSGLNAVARGSFQAGVIDMIAQNAIVVEKPSPSGMGQEVSLEQIASDDPEMIVFGPGSIYGTVGDDPAWADITAIREKNYYQVPGMPYNWVSSPAATNQVIGMQWFARICYPEKFETTVQDVAVAYFKTFYDYDLSEEECASVMEGALPKGE